MRELLTIVAILAAIHLVGFAYSKIFGFVGGFRIWYVWFWNGALGTIGQSREIPQLTHEEFTRFEEGYNQVIKHGRTVWVFTDWCPDRCFKYRGLSCWRCFVSASQLRRHSGIPANPLSAQRSEQ